MKTTTKNEDDLKQIKMTVIKRDYLKIEDDSKNDGGNGFSSKTMFPAPDTCKSCKWQSNIANLNYYGLVFWSKNFRSKKILGKKNFVSK